jgi:phosphatidylglycerol:prolipoprotein diacylglycerol transferase
LPFWSLFDIVSAVVPIGLFFGRIANFINAELWGRLSIRTLGGVFPTGGPFARHPSQLYEAALEGLVLLTVLAVMIYYRTR